MGAVNRLLLVAKAHYFVFFGGIAGGIPFFMTMAGQFGASPQMIGIIYSTLPFFALLSKPLFGSVADKFQQKKSIFIACIVVMFGAFFATYFIPVDPRGPPSRGPTMLVTCDATGLTFPCIRPPGSDESAGTVLGGRPTSAVTNATCHFACHVAKVRDRLGDGPCNDSLLSCNSETDDAARLSNDSVWMALSEFHASVTYLEEMDASNSSHCRLDQWPPAASAHPVPRGCEVAILIPCEIHCSGNEFFSPIVPGHARANYSTGEEAEGGAEEGVYDVPWRVIALWICMVVGWIGMSVAVSMGDTIVIDLLSNKGHFGRQRLWGAASWGALSVLTGFLVDVASHGKPYKDFSPGHYLILACGVLDVVAALYLRVEKSERPRHLFRNVGGLLWEPGVAVFSASVFMVGCFTGVLWTFLIVYLNDLDAPQLLIGLAMGVQSFLGEIPFFFFSDWLLKKIGHVHSMTLVLAIFGCRFLVYSLITDPWTVLPMELTQGVTFGLFFAALATYPSRMAPASLQATLQGILQGLFEGFGVGVGSLIAGTLYQTLGGKTMFRILGIAAFCSSASIGLLQYVIQRRKLRNGSPARHVTSQLRGPSEGQEMLPVEEFSSNHSAKMTTK